MHPITTNPSQSTPKTALTPPPMKSEEGENKEQEKEKKSTSFAVGNKNSNRVEEK
jgi:hypothetical protein